MFDLSSLGGWIAAFWSAVGGALAFRDAVFLAVTGEQGGLAVALLVLLVAGISLGVGQSVVLFANRVSPRGFAVSLAGGAFVVAAGAFLWAVSAWLIARLLFGVQMGLGDVYALICLGFAPAVFGFLVLLPYFGNWLFQIMRVYGLAIVLVGVGTVAGLGFWPALATTGLGWLIYETLTRVPLFDLDRMPLWLWRLLTGREQRFAADALALRLADDVHRWVAETPEGDFADLWDAGQTAQPADLPTAQPAVGSAAEPTSAANRAAAAAQDALDEEAVS
jgi:hypothetical protein